MLSSSRRTPDSESSRICRTSAHSWGKLRGWSMVVFYPKGVRWACHRCAICCANTSTHNRTIRLLQDEIEKLARVTGRKEDEFSEPTNDEQLYPRMMKKRGGKCFFLRDDLCLVYDNRPLTCAFYPFFLTQASANSMKICLTPEACPGLGKGEVIQRDYYARLLQLALQKMPNITVPRVRSLLE